MARFFTLMGLLAASTVSIGAGADGLNFPFPNATSPQPFEISVNPKFIQETVQKVALYRPSIPLKQDPEGADLEWADGPPPQDINALAQHWRSRYDWYTIQDEINANFSHYATSVPGTRNYQHPIPLHFIHEPSSHSNATPLVLLHGWPSTHLEWSKVVKPLAHPNDSKPAFHIVAPNLPGFGFSPAPIYSGMGPREIGDAIDALMKQLGYTSYAIASTDLGWLVGMYMGSDHENSIIAHFTDFFSAAPNATDLARFEVGETTPEETRYLQGVQAFQTANSGYQVIQSTRPLSLALAMTDSPVGFAGWVWQLLYTASGGYNYTLDELITTAMVLWIPGTYGNLRSYKEFVPALTSLPKSNVPTGVTEWTGKATYPGMKWFPFVPRSWIERSTNLVYFSRHEVGGHFPAINEPDLWVDEVQTFFSQLP